MPFTTTEESFQLGVDALRKLSFDEDAELTFDHMRGALVWRDEFDRDPREYAVALNLHADLIVYRRLLIQGADDDALRSTWERALEAMPAYPVFRLERRDPGLREALADGLKGTQRMVDVLKRLERMCAAKRRRHP